MTTKILFILSAILLTLNAKGQTNASQITVQNKDFIKPYIGATTFNIVGAASDFKAKSGLVVGASYELATPIRNFSVDAGLEYLQSGAQREYVWADSGEQAIKQELNMTYLAIPVKARYQIFSQGVDSLKYKVIGGLTVAQLLSAKSKTNIFGQQDEKDMTSAFHSIDVLASAGVGAEYEMLGWVASLDIEYTRGLLEIAKDTAGHQEGAVVKAGFAMPL